MKIKAISKLECKLVETDEEEFSDYIRYSPQDWMVTMGMSEETVSYSEKLEEAFQTYIKEHPDEI